MARFKGAFPMCWLRGHQLSKPVVNTSNARFALAFTVMHFRTGASCIAPPLWIVCCALLIVPPFLVFFSLLLSLRSSLRLPALLWVLPPPCGEMLAMPDPRTARSIRAKSQSPQDATGTAGDFLRPGPPPVLPPSARASAAKWPAG